MITDNGRSRLNYYNYFTEIEDTFVRRRGKHLLLSPIDGNETKRDGTFSYYRNGEPQRTYQYQMVDANQRLILQ